MYLQKTISRNIATFSVFTLLWYCYAAFEKTSKEDDDGAMGTVPKRFLYNFDVDDETGRYGIIQNAWKEGEREQRLIIIVIIIV